jgi:hypothetical protein
MRLISEVAQARGAFLITMYIPAHERTWVLECLNAQELHMPLDTLSLAVAAIPDRIHPRGVILHCGYSHSGKWMQRLSHPGDPTFNNRELWATIGTRFHLIEQLADETAPVSTANH